jgi:hypothetical protein
MLYPGSSKPGIIANEQIRIQIVDTHESLETVPRVGFPAGGGQFNRTLLIRHIFTFDEYMEYHIRPAVFDFT